MPAGSVSGTLAVPSDVDWYRIGVGEGRGILVAFHAAGGTVEAYLYGEDGRFLRMLGKGHPIGDVPGAHAYVRVSDWCVCSNASASYAFDSVILDAPDVRVDDLEVAPMPFTTDAGDLPVGRFRRVSFTVTNDGVGAADHAWIDVTSEQDRSSRHVAWFLVTLAPGQSRDFSVEWDTLGQAGDATLRVRTFTMMDADRSNDEASARSYALVGNVGAGVDALNRYASAPLLYSGTSYSQGTVGLIAFAPLVSAHASASAQHGQARAFACVYPVVPSCVFA